MRYDIISDTHGFLEPDLLDQLQGADVIVHAGDICSGADYRTLQKIAPVQMCLGNNDWAYEYGPEVKTRKVFFSSGLRWQVVHYRQHLNLLKCDVAICGHTHRPFVERDEWTGTLVMVGRGLRKPEWVREVLEARDRTAAGENAPAAGLVFWKVQY